MKKLKRDFFNRPTLVVAEALLGKILVFKEKKGIITETEAYCGFDDPASHAARGQTPRNKIMFGKPGFAYVYLIYGMYYCLNFVTEEAGFPAAVLIRGLKLLEDPKNKDENSKVNQSLNTSKKTKKSSILHLNGPGKLCRALGITKAQNGIDIINNKEFYVADNQQSLDFIQTPRIGIRVGLDKHWRFLANIY